MKKELKDLLNSTILGYLKEHYRKGLYLFSYIPSKNIQVEREDMPEDIEENYSFNTFEDALNSEILAWENLFVCFRSLYDYISSNEFFQGKPLDEEYKKVKEQMQNYGNLYNTDGKKFRDEIIAKKLSEYLTEDMIFDIGISSGIFEKRKNDLIEEYYNEPYEIMKTLYDKYHSFYEEDEDEDEENDDNENNNENKDILNKQVDFDKGPKFNRINRILNRMYKDARKMK